MGQLGTSLDNYNSLFTVYLIKVSTPEGKAFKPNLDLYLNPDGSQGVPAEFAINDPTVTECDVWVVIDNVNDDDLVADTRRVIFWSAEYVWGPDRYITRNEWKSFLSQFDQIRTNQYYEDQNVIFDFPLSWWMINGTPGGTDQTGRDYKFFQDLNRIPKKNAISVACSRKGVTRYHRIRVRFLEFLKKELGDSLIWFGEDTPWIANKWEATSPYAFHIALQNQATVGTLDTRLFDSFLGLSYPFYWGDPTAGEYVGRQALTPLNIFDPRGSVETLANALSDNLYETAHESLLQAKTQVLTDLNPLFRIRECAKLALATADETMRRKKLIPFRPSRIAGSYQRLTRFLSLKRLD